MKKVISLNTQNTQTPTTASIVGFLLCFSKFDKLPLITYRHGTGHFALGVLLPAQFQHNLTVIADARITIAKRTFAIMPSS